ncbi:hypothetical protein F5051DRAFT_473071 [Lentinula edodes]|nr:hypothetical protein F5051DRAFT_473071 [Lentinula edodes]
MTKRLEIDPAKIPAPNFASRAHTFMRNALITDANTPEITTDEHAAQRLKVQWEIHIEGPKAQYEVQLREAETLREQRRQEAADAERLAAVEQQEKEKELAKEADKKRMPIYSFQKGVGVESIPLQVHPYAKKMMTARKYVPLWYFLPDAATEAKERSKDSLVGSHTVRASPNAIPDSRLSWPQVMRAKSAFLNTLRLGAWPDDHISMFAAFYINMDMHSELQEQDGDRVMAHYHAEMRLAWYDAMERKEPFDLSVISNRVLAESRREIVKQRQEKSLKDIQAATALMEARVDAKLQKLSQITSTPPFPSPRQSSGKARTMSGTAHELRSGTGNVVLPATGTSKVFSRSPVERTPGSNSVLTGNVETAAPARPTQKSTGARDARAAVTELAAALKVNENQVNTPLQAEVWFHAISELNLNAKYPTLVESI